MTVLSDAEIVQAEELVLANQILAKKEIVDGFGHVSVRSATRPDHFLLSRNMAPSLVTAPDIHVFDSTGACVTAPEIRSYLERFIHSEIYQARPDVGSIVHSHSPSVIPFSVVPGQTLQPIYHMAGFIGTGLPVFEIRDFVERSDMLIRDGDLGRALAAQLNSSAGILMRGHGSTVVGNSLRQAIYRAVYLETNARIQAVALGLGEPVFLSSDEASAAAAANDGQVDRPWDLWVRDLIYRCGQ